MDSKTKKKTFLEQNTGFLKVIMGLIVYLGQWFRVQFEECFVSLKILFIILKIFYIKNSVNLCIRKIEQTRFYFFSDA